MKLTSSYNDEYLKKWIAFNRTREKEVLVMFGLGTGMFVKAFLSDSENRGRMVVLEPDLALVNRLRQDTEFNSLLEDDRVDVIIDGLNDNYFNNFLYNKFSKFSSEKTDESFERFKVAIYPNYHILYPDETSRFLATVDEVSDMIKAGESVKKRFGKDIEKNIVINEKRLFDSLSLVELSNRLPKDIPVIIAASGPSLSKNIKELKRAKGRSFIIGLDSSLPALLKEDIIPDMYVSIDPTKISKHFVDERIKDIPVVAMLQSPEHVIKEGQKYFFIFGGDEKVLPMLKQKNAAVVTVPALGSVANTAFTLVNMMHFKTIVFVGQDLAYTDDKYHADNTVHLETSFKTDTIIMLPGIDGNEVKSSREFRMYKTGFEKIIEMFPKHEFIDATEGGAYIKGTKTMPLSELVDEICVKNIDIAQYFDGLPKIV